MFLLFGGQTYYAAGGWKDYEGAFSSAEAAIASGKYLMQVSQDEDHPRYYHIEWFHVVNFDTGEVVHKEGENYS